MVKAEKRYAEVVRGASVEVLIDGYLRKELSLPKER